MAILGLGSGALACFWATDGTSNKSLEVTRSSSHILLTPVTSKCLSNRETVASACPANLQSSTFPLLAMSSCMLERAPTRASPSPPLQQLLSPATATPSPEQHFSQSSRL